MAAQQATRHAADPTQVPRLRMQQEASYKEAGGHMTDQAVIEIGRSAFVTGLMLAAPLLLVALITGLLVSIVQTVTQLNEATLTFVPKMLAVFAALLLFGPWMIRIMLAYTTNLFALMPSLAR